MSGRADREGDAAPTRRDGLAGVAGPFGGPDAADPGEPDGPADAADHVVPFAEVERSRRGPPPTSVPPDGPAASHPPTAAGVEAVGRSRPFWLVLVAAGSVAAVAAVATTAVWWSSRSDGSGLAASVLGVVALTGLALATWKLVQIHRVQRLVTDHPWRARTGHHDVARVQGRDRRTLRHISFVTIDHTGVDPEATCPLATLHWSAGPPPAGPVDLWVAGDPTRHAVVSLPGGADVLLATGTRWGFRERFFRDRLVRRG